MRRSRASLVALTALASLAGACTVDRSSGGGEGSTADFSGLAEGWNAIVPGGEAVCSDGSPYQFFVRPGDPGKLLFYLEGGGACWNGGTCDRDLRPTYAVEIGDRSPDGYGGIFAFQDPENPFADYSVVFAPYCTGDVHIGDADVTYEAPDVEDHRAHEVQVRHRGGRNVQAVLDWTRSRISSPATVFVTGSSAGSIPSPYYTVRLARIYPGARITQLGDGSGGYRRSEEGFRPEESWGSLDLLTSEPAFAHLTPETFDFEELYVAAAGSHPEITFARYDTAEDSVQLGFLELGGEPAGSLLPLLKANQADIDGRVDNVRSFIAGGGVHTILGRPEFYTLRVGEVRVRDWVAALARGQPVDDVACRDCAVAETAEREGSAGPREGGGV